MIEPFKITELWAFVSKDKDGEEGVCGFHSKDGVFWPMVAADVARLKDYFPIAEDISKMEIISVITPEGTNHL